MCLAYYSPLVVLFRAKIHFNSSPWKQGNIPFLALGVLVKVFLVFSCVNKKNTKKLLCLVHGLDLRKCDLGQEYRGLLQTTQWKKQLLSYTRTLLLSLINIGFANEFTGIWIIATLSSISKVHQGNLLPKKHAGWFTQQIILTDSILNGKCGSNPAASSWPSGLLCVWHALIQL